MVNVSEVTETLNKMVNDVVQALNPQVDPFHGLATKDTVMKVWDILAWSRWSTYGRVRILARVPKNPQPLVNIPFAIAWCCPKDMPRFNKRLSNLILTGRFAKFACNDNKPYNTVQYLNDNLLNTSSITRNCGLITEELPDLKDFPKHVLRYVGEVPEWFAQFVAKPVKEIKNV